MKDRTIASRVARYRRKLASDRDWKRVEAFVPASDAGALRAYAGYLRSRDRDAWPHGSLPLGLAPLMEDLAARYVWWKEPRDAIAAPERVALQVMDIGDHADVRRLERLAGQDFLRHALLSAEPGQLSPRSWTFWSHRLGLVTDGEVPPMPTRVLA